MRNIDSLRNSGEFRRIYELRSSEADRYLVVYQAEGNEALVNRMESLHGIHTLEHAEEIGLGSRTYELVNIDKLNDDYIPKFGKIM